MLRSFIAGCFAVVTAFGCAASSDSSDAGTPAYREVVCHDARYTSVFEDEAACHVYLDACLGKLTPAQRTSWDARVDACIEHATDAECFAEVPWC